VSAQIETVKGFHKIMSQAFDGVPAEKGKICEVFFHNPVLIDANRFYNILFELDVRGERYIIHRTLIPHNILSTQ